MSFDNAYFSGANLRYLEANGLDGYEGEHRRMTAKMRSEAGKEAYKKRKETVEWPFGNIKQNLKFREFLTCGIEKVRVEHNPICIAHNLKVLWGKLERNVPVIGTIRVLVANSVSKVGNFSVLIINWGTAWKCQ